MLGAGLQRPGNLSRPKTLDSEVVNEGIHCTDGTPGLFLDSGGVLVGTVDTEPHQEAATEAALSRKTPAMPQLNQVSASQACDVRRFPACFAPGALGAALGAVAGAAGVAAAGAG